MSELINKCNFYVYQYLRSHVTEHGPVGSPYYVGKGNGKRAYQKSHRVHIPKDKANILFVAENVSENDAFQLEKDLIKFYGRIDLGTGCLWNMTEGGEGPSGKITSAETKAKMSAAHKLRRSAKSNEPKQNLDFGAKRLL